MERDEMITRYREELERIQQLIDHDENLSDEDRASFTKIMDELRASVEEGGSPTGDQLSMIAGLLGEQTDEGASNAPSSMGTWKQIRTALADTMGLRHIMYSDDEDGYVTAQFGMSDGEGRKLNMRVTFTPDADCVQIRAGYPFDIDLRILPIARMYVCRRNFEMRYTRIEMDARDGEVLVNLVLHCLDHDALPEGFEDMVRLTMSVGFDEYDALRRYSRAEFTDEEREEFLKEVEKISALMLED